MALTRRQTLLNRSINTRHAKVFIIATEDSIGTPAYFEAFNPVPGEREPFAPSPVVVKVLPPLENRSSPRHVLKQAQDFVSGIKLDPRDEVWLVLDVDRWETSTLGKVHAAARRAHYEVAISNPCYEVWLCLHFSNCDNTAIAEAIQGHQVGNQLKRLWRSYLPPSTTNIERTILLPLAKEACVRARREDKGDLDPAHPWPFPPGTRIYLLVERILSELDE